MPEAESAPAAQGWWKVEAGAVELWRTVAGRPPQFLFASREGELILAAPGLHLRAAPGGRLSPVAEEEAGLLAVANDPAVHAWLKRLAGLLAEDLPSSLPEPLPLDQPIDLQEGEVVETSTEELCWLVCKAGVVRLVNIVDLPADAPPLPMPPGVWLTSAQRAACSLIPRLPDPSGAKALEGLHCFTQLVLAVLDVHDQRQVERQREQLRHRREDDLRQTGEALSEVASVLGVQPSLPPTDELLAALSPIGRALGVSFRAPAWPVEGDAVAAVAEASRVRFRRVRLRDDWQRLDAGPLLGFLHDKEAVRPVALLPTTRGYQMTDPRQTQALSVTGAVREQLADDAVVFYRPLPPGSPGLLALARWGLAPFRREVGRILALMLAVSLLGMLTPVALRWIVDEILSDGGRQPLVEVCVALLAVGVCQALLLLAEGFLSVRVQTGLTVQVQSAIWDRLLRLGPGFFRAYTAGDLHQRAMLITEISRHINGTILRTLLGGVLALLNFVLLLVYAPHLALVALGLALLGAAASVVISLGIRRLALRMMLQEGRLLGFVVELIQGISRLRVAAAERRAFNQWAQRFAEQLRLLAGIRFREDLNKLLTTVLSSLSMLLLLGVAGSLLQAGGPGGTTLSPGAFVAFLTAYGLFVAGVTAVSQTLVDVVDVLAREHLLRPLLQEPMEDTGRRAQPGPLRGHAALEQVHFRYRPGDVFALRDINLTARPGEFLAIVGPSGSGKSTLLRLLLGFEQPESGRVLYDGRNLDSLDLTAVRQQLGVVLQSSWILAGSLYENIATGHPIAPEKVWEALDAAGLAADVEELPMKLHSLIAAGGANLSGGQRQRLLLARALVQNPRLLFLDEATSALDNPTQGRISANLRQRRITRIAIAHRLSTIVHADRICVMDQGRIVQTGTFAELAAQEGVFRTLMHRQQAQAGE
jgi:NHLM bacteriocin system ABC transporter ATP-binding protein